MKYHARSYFLEWKEDRSPISNPEVRQYFVTLYQLCFTERCTAKKEKRRKVAGEGEFSKPCNARLRFAFKFLYVTYLRGSPANTLRRIISPPPSQQKIQFLSGGDLINLSIHVLRLEKSNLISGLDYKLIRMVQGHYDARIISLRRYNRI